jgi:hypothetical protein
MQTRLLVLGSALFLSNATASRASTLTFTPLPDPPASAEAMWLMQDGTVLVQLSSDDQSLMRLTPDFAGSYVNGTWTSAGSFLTWKADFSSVVLSDGRLVTCGGEYSGMGGESNFCEIYNPVTMNARSFAAPAGWTNIGDGPSAILPDGTWLLGNTQGLGQFSAVLDPKTLAWTTYTGDSNNEQGYTLLQTGDVLTTHVYDKSSWRFDLAQGGFVQDNPVPIRLGVTNFGGTGSGEIGPSMTLADGRVVWFGSNGHTAIYTPTSAGQNGSWVQGPDLPLYNGGQLVAADSPALLEPNGRVLLPAFVVGTSEATFVEFFPERLAFEIVTNGPTNFDAESMRMLVLPDGHGLISSNNGPWLDVAFNGNPQAAWAPTVASFPSTVAPGATVNLAGTQLAGRSECSMYGDDNQQGENYPVVRFTDASNIVTYGRAHHVSTRSIAPGQSGTVEVDIPGSLPLGEYSMQLVTCGIPSANMTVTAQCPVALPHCVPCSQQVGPAKSCPYYGDSCVIEWTGCF